MLILLSVFAIRFAAAQKINFGAYTTSQGISLTVSNSLNFNDKQPVITSNSSSTVTIALVDNETQYIKIIADATRDITITVTADTHLFIGVGPSNEIPFVCNFAYSNLGSAVAATAKSSAIEIPAGFTAITLPMLRRTAGVPAPPPTPAHGGYSAPSATAYLFIYGKLGPVGNVNAGNYTGTINVSVNYTTY
jgi:spore coat protein U-like protein